MLFASCDRCYSAQPAWHGATVTKRQDRSVGLQHHGVEVADRDRLHIRLWRWGTGVPPAHGRAITLQSHGVLRACRDGDHVAQTSGHIPLTINIVAPHQHGPVTLERHTMEIARRYGNHAGEPRGHVVDATEVRAPRCHRPVALHRQGVIPPGGYRRGASQAARQSRLLILPSPPGHVFRLSTSGSGPHELREPPEPELPTTTGLSPERPR